MESYNFPIAHFRLMSAIAAQLAIKSIQLLEHHYDYNHFGSWWFSFKNTKGTFQINFDGRDYLLSLEVGDESPDRIRIASWKNLVSEKVKDHLNSEATIEIVKSLIERADRA
jgi:hypothetical protein